MNEQLDSRCSQIIILPGPVFGTTYIVEEYHLPADIVEQYSVYYKDAHIANFYVSNSYEDSIHFLIPLDITIIKYVIQEQEVRSLKKQWDIKKN